MEITQERINAAYAIADDSQKKLLDALFGEQNVKDNRPVTERIKTFEDALSALGEDHAYVQEYRQFVAANITCFCKDLEAYIKLRIIVAALNEGWTPEFIKGEYRWAPWFRIYTNEHLADMEDGKKEDIIPCRAAYCTNYDAKAVGGVACAGGGYDTMCSHAGIGSCLAFKTEELAEYAGKQFIGIYAEMMGLTVRS